MSYAHLPQESYPTRQRAARPDAPKVPISIRVDEDVIDYFKQSGKYQREINRVLRRHVERQKRKQLAAG